MHTGLASSGRAVIDHCRTVAGFSDEPGAITRTFLGPAMRDCLAHFQAWADRLGMLNRIDAAGNFRGLLKGKENKRLVIGSHLDSVPHAGAFDGVLGVVMGMTMAETFQHERPNCTLEIVGFSEEEGVRFQRPFIGSKAFVTGLDDEFLGLRDAGEISVQQAIERFGLHTEGIRQPQMDSADGFLEFHIEQGPVLESLGLPLAVVDAIAGQTRAGFEFLGQTNHAGTTPMNLRQDAFCAAAEWALLVEGVAREFVGLVATVGSVRVSPDASNVVPGMATLSLDLRHADDDVRLKVFDALLKEAERVATGRRVKVRHTVRLNQAAVPMDSGMVDRLSSVLNNPHKMTSGAGHDAMIVAPHIPSVMLVVRSPGGVSHHPDEAVSAEDVELALTAGRAFVQNFA